MTDEELQHYLADNGYAQHVAKAGGAGLVKRWHKFVQQVEGGFPLGLEDYRQELDVRGILTLAGLDEQVRDADHQFAELLVHREQRVWESDATTDPFWDYGYPRNASGELWEDLQAEGLTEDHTK